MKRLLAIAIVLAACDRKSADSPAPGTTGGSGPPITPAGSATGSGPAGSGVPGVPGVPGAPGSDGSGGGAAGTAASDPCSKAHPEGGMTMPWIVDDLPSALACARQRKVPVMVDLWAPWCHTCLSMQSTVFTDPSFKPDVDRFVFAALDTDKEVNAAAVATFPPSVWPTFYIIGRDPTTRQSDAVLARFAGAASLAQFHSFLETGLRAQQGGAAGADGKLLEAERQIAAKNYGGAEQSLASALLLAPADWPRRPDVLTSLIANRAKRKDFAGCVDLSDQMDQTGNAAAATDFLVTALGCASQLQDDPAYAAMIKRLRTRAAARLTKLVADAGAPLSVDDRSDALATLREVQDQLGKPADAKATAENQRALLDAAAAKAPTPMTAMTYNWQRCDVYNYLGKPLDLVPALEQSAKDLPDEYDPRARLGWLYLKADKLPEAARWTDEALRMVYGPRKARLIAQRAEIAAKQHDAAGEKRYRKDLVALWEAMPPGQASPEALDKARTELAAIDPAAAGSAAAGSAGQKPASSELLEMNVTKEMKSRK
jgi:thioredoxin-like negative regulator of GroEL